jgi:hypothetical protein
MSCRKIEQPLRAKEQTRNAAGTTTDHRAGILMVLAMLRCQYVSGIACIHQAGVQRDAGVHKGRPQVAARKGFPA